MKCRDFQACFVRFCLWGTTAGWASNGECHVHLTSIVPRLSARAVCLPQRHVEHISRAARELPVPSHGQTACLCLVCSSWLASLPEARPLPPSRTIENQGVSCFKRR